MSPGGRERDAAPFPVADRNAAASVPYGTASISRGPNAISTLRGNIISGALPFADLILPIL